MDIIFSANNNETVLVLPVLPEKMPELINSYNNSTFETVKGEINLIGQRALRTVNIQSFFPVNKNYPFIRPQAEKDGWKYVNFFNKYTKQRVPIRMVWTDNFNEISNLAYTVESFSTQINKRGDIEFNLDLKEYRFVSALPEV